SPSTLGKRFKVFFPTETWPGERYPWLRLRPRTSWPHKPPYTIPSIFEMHSPTSHAQSSHTGPTWQEESRLVILAMFGGIPYRFDVPRSANIDGIKIQIFSFYGLSLMEYQLVYLFNVEGYAPIDSDNQWTACIAEQDELILGKNAQDYYDAATVLTCRRTHYNHAAEDDLEVFSIDDLGFDLLSDLNFHHVFKKFLHTLLVISKFLNQLHVLKKLLFYTLLVMSKFCESAYHSSSLKFPHMNTSA
ncbi:hypothetical protein Tco_0595554, partial [Tanacetum coccineum]